MTETNSKYTNNIFNFTVIVAALGYFVDMYDLILFGIVRVASLKGIGIPDNQSVDVGLRLLNMQMIGMLTGGILWGILGDKKGRVSVLFGSVFLYSIANIANAFVTDITQYSIVRFIAGIGLAGELGVAVTLVSEILPQEKRGYGTTIVASLGIMGAVTAGLVGNYLKWTHAYLIGGSLGLILLLLRFRIYDSGLFKSSKNENVSRGDFFSLFTSKERFFKYIYCILLGLPIWYVIGILVSFSPEFAKNLHINGSIIVSKSITFFYIGVVLGDIVSGVLSQKIKSRKKVLIIFISSTLCCLVWYFNSYNVSPEVFYTMLCILGFATGYWAVLITVGAEQFGTNLRATVSSTVPNFIRGSLVPITILFTYFKGSFGMINGAILVGIIIFYIVYFALYKLQETYHKDLDYNEMI